MGIAVDKSKKEKDKTQMIDRLNAKTPLGGKPPVHDMIGRLLRDHYDEVVKQPVPDRFVELLQQLESKTSKKDG